VLGYPTDLSLSLSAKIRVSETKSTAVVDMRECPVLSYQTDETLIPRIRFPETLEQSNLRQV
jgi:hypothetical protein